MGMLLLLHDNDPASAYELTIYAMDRHFANVMAHWGLWLSNLHVLRGDDT